MKALFLALLISGSLAAHSETIGKDHPCHKIKEACESAGFKKGHHKEGKGLWKDCVNKLKSGESIPGVTVDTGEVEACHAKMMEKKSKQKTM